MSWWDDIWGDPNPTPGPPDENTGLPKAKPAKSNVAGQMPGPAAPHPSTLDDMLSKAGFTDNEKPTMKAIIQAESGGRANAINTKNTNGSIDRGLAQINSVHKQYDPKQLMDPQYNLNAAHDIYKSQGLKAWSTYNNGAYKKFLGQASRGDLAPPKPVATPAAPKTSRWSLPGLGIGGNKGKVDTPAGGAPAKSKFFDPSLLSPSAKKEAGVPEAPQTPVAHPGHIPVPLHRTGAANGGHAQVHPPIPHTSPLHVRHTRPPHAVAKATGGTQKGASSGAAAGHPVKPKIGKAESFHHKPPKPKKHHKPKKPKNTARKTT